MGKTRRFTPTTLLTDPPKKMKGRGHQQTYDILGQQVEVLVTAKGEVYWRYVGNANWLLAADTAAADCGDLFRVFLCWAGGIR